MVSKLNLYDKLKTKLINFIIIKAIRCKHYYRVFKVNGVIYGDSIDAIKYYNRRLNYLSIIDLIQGKVNKVPIYKYLVNDIFKRKTIFRIN